MLYLLIDIFLRIGKHMQFAYLYVPIWYPYIPKLETSRIRQTLMAPSPVISTVQSNAATWTCPRDPYIGWEKICKTH